MQRWKRYAAAASLAAVAWAGCSDRATTEPKFDRPTGTIIGLDRTIRRSSRELGGNQAMAEISGRMGEASLASSDPLERAVAEWRAKQGILAGKAAVRMYEGVEEFDGDYYVWSQGESYAPIEKQAKIRDLFTQASRVGGDGPVDIVVTFKFDGHRASNDATWRIYRSDGTDLIDRPRAPFGSQTDPFLNMTIFGDRGWAASSTEYVDGCDVIVSGTTYAAAWYEGAWDVNGASIGANPAGATGQINLSRRHSGEVNSNKPIGTQFTCPPPGGGGGGGYGGGGDDCWICQEWFSIIDEELMFEWWECGPASPTECQALST